MNTNVVIPQLQPLYRAEQTIEDQLKNPKAALFHKEISCAVKWLMEIQDQVEHGWGWLQHIPPNEQNTAEVICAILSQDFLLDKTVINKLSLSIKKYLLEPTGTAKITFDWAWVLKALLSIEQNKDLFKDTIEIEVLQQAKNCCVNWLIENQNVDGGWGDCKGDFSSVSRTALVLNVLCLTSRGTEHYSRIFPHIEQAENWILRMKGRRDGGWGNIRKEDIHKHHEQYKVISQDNIEYQYLPNPACTSYVILALKTLNPIKYKQLIKDAAIWLIKQQNKTGSWKIFFEIGFREGKIYTFRHFSSVWAMEALLASEVVDFQDNVILDGLEYILDLQDPICGGWRTSKDTDPFTWASCNVIELLHKVQLQTMNISSEKFLAIIKEWRKLKLEKEVYNIKLKNNVLSFNSAMFILQCFLFSLFCIALISLSITISSSKLEKYYISWFFVLILCIPWVIFLRFYAPKKHSWLESIGYITGPVLAVFSIIFNYLI